MHPPTKFCLAFIILILVSCRFQAQSPVHSIRGKVVDAIHGRGVEYTSVLNFSRQTRIYCNAGGEFRMDAQRGDTLVFYAVGYYYRKVIVEDAMLYSTDPFLFTLQQQALEIAEVRIIGLGTYEEFKQDFIHLDRPRTKTDELAENLAQASHVAAREAYEKAKADKMLDGITLVTVPILTPEEKERLVLARIIKQEKIEDQIYQKFNPMVVKKVTGLTDDDEVIAFMLYCNYSDVYLLDVNEYDLMVSLARKFEMYQEKKKEERSMQNRLVPDDRDDLLDVQHLISV